MQKARRDVHCVGHSAVLLEPHVIDIHITQFEQNEITIFVL